MSEILFRYEQVGAHDLGLPLVAPDDRALLQVQPLLERAKSRPVDHHPARARFAAGSIRHGPAVPHRGHPPDRAHRLHLAVRRERLPAAAAALGCGDGPAAALGAESLGRRADVSRHLAVSVPDGQCRHRYARATDVAGSQRADQLQNLESSQNELSTLKTHGPGFPLIYLLPHISTQSLLGNDGQDIEPVPNTPVFSVRRVNVVTAQVMAILSQFAIVLGIVLIGLRHFDNIRGGIAAATFYLLLPYTAMWTGAVTHALPAALLVWAVLLYRRPLLAGAMLGLAFGTIYYPIFLLPLWISFYWQKGVVRFLLGFAATVAVLVVTLAFTTSDMAMFLACLKQMFGVQFPIAENLRGAWQFWNTVYRYPIIAAFIGLSISFVIWPAQKNLATLISCSAALMLGTQFWHAHTGGGVALAWYLPLLLLTVFRPNLEDRVATAVVK